MYSFLMFITTSCLQVGSRVLLDQNPTGMSGPGVRTGPFSQRPFLTLDFSSSDSIKNSNFGPLSCVPVSSQETAIVQDLLYAFIGIPGVHIRFELVLISIAINT